MRFKWKNKVRKDNKVIVDIYDGRVKRVSLQGRGPIVGASIVPYELNNYIAADMVNKISSLKDFAEDFQPI
jgi:hypothetical protein